MPTADGERLYVEGLGGDVACLQVQDGEFLWRYDPVANRMGINCSTPIYHDGMVFAASAYGAGGGLVKLSKDESGGVKTEEAYFSKKMQDHHGGMILFDGSLDGANGGNEGGALVCLDFKKGNVLWDERDDTEHRARTPARASVVGPALSRPTCFVTFVNVALPLFCQSCSPASPAMARSRSPS